MQWVLTFSDGGSIIDSAC